MRSTFGAILRNAVRKTPGAVGAAFSARDGEMVDAWTEWEATEWAIATAHIGIVLSQVQAALHTFHFGDVELLQLNHEELEILAQPVREGYFAVLALKPPAALAAAIQNLEHAVSLLRLEME